MRKPKLRKYPNGGTEAKKAYSLDEYNTELSKYEKIDPLNPKDATDVKQYIGSYITPNIKNYQTQLNTALRAKYKLAADAPITDQYLSADEANKAVGGKYDDYMNNFNAYQAYRAKTPAMPQRGVEGTQDQDPKVYGQRHVNLFKPYTVNTEIPQFGSGGMAGKPRLQKAKYGLQVAPAAISNDPNYDDGQNQDNNDPSTGQYVAAGTALGVGAANTYQAYNNPTATARQRADAPYNSSVQAVGAINPLIGGIIGIGDAVGSPIRANNEKTDAQGNLEHYNNSITIGASFLNPAKALATRASYKGGWTDWDGSKYKANLEKDAKAALPKTPFVPYAKDYRQDAVWQKTNDHVEYAMGGPVTDPNAELEKQEVMMQPDGTTDQVDGPSHEQGGVPVNVPAGTKIYSDKLKLPGTKVTIAKLAEKFKTNKEEKVLDDDKATNTAKATAKLVAQTKQRKLDQLFQAQEAYKQQRVAQYARKMGVTLPQQQEQPQMRNGGYIPKYENGALTPMTAEDPELRQGLYSGNDYMFNTQDRPTPFYQTPMDQMQMRGTPDLGNQPGTPDQIAPNYNPGSPYTSNQRPNLDWRNIGEGAFNNVAQNAGNIYDLYKSRFGTKYDRENYGQLTPSYVSPKTVDDRESLRDSDREATASRGNLRNMVGGNAGAYMANLSANQTANTLSKAKIREGINNTNTSILNTADATDTDIKNQFAQYNKNLKISEMTANEQNKARSEDMAAHAVRDIGSKSASAYKDYKDNEMNTKEMNLINQYFPNYKFDPNTYQLYYNAAQSQSTRSSGRRTKSRPSAKSGIGYTAE